MYKQTNNIWTHHKLYNSNENKIPVFPECVCNRWRYMVQQTSQAYNHGNICGIRLIAIFNRAKWLKIRFWKSEICKCFFLIPSLHYRIIVVFGGVLAAIICVPTACTRRPRGALGDLTALLLRCRCEPTAFTRRLFRSPWERRATARTLCMHKVRAVAWRPRRPHCVQWRCHGDPSAL